MQAPSTHVVVPLATTHYVCCRPTETTTSERRTCPLHPSSPHHHIYHIYHALRSTLPKGEPRSSTHMCAVVTIVLVVVEFGGLPSTIRPPSCSLIPLKAGRLERLGLFACRSTIELQLQMHPLAGTPPGPQGTRVAGGRQPPQLHGLPLLRPCARIPAHGTPSVQALAPLGSGVGVQ